MNHLTMIRPMHAHDGETAEDRALQKLIDSPFFRSWKKAFALATGLEVECVKATDGTTGPHADPRSANPFCRALRKAGGCQGCSQSFRFLTRDADAGPFATTCFAGMREAAIPVRIGDHPVAYLIAGQVFDRTPDPADFIPIEARLRADGVSEAEIPWLRETFVSGPVLDPARFQAATTLLVVFSLQLTQELDRLLVVGENADSPTIARAKQYLNAHLEERISLDEVSSHVGVSPFYFCKIFKQATGMTLTEYINRRRVERAKRKLLNPHARVTEVAFDVGYQSLSQFNRSFLRYVGESPTRYREQSHTAAIPQAA